MLNGKKMAILYWKLAEDRVEKGMVWLVVWCKIQVETSHMIVGTHRHDAIFRMQMSIKWAGTHSINDHNNASTRLLAFFLAHFPHSPCCPRRTPRPRSANIRTHCASRSRRSTWTPFHVCTTRKKRTRRIAVASLLRMRRTRCSSSMKAKPNGRRSCVVRVLFNLSPCCV
jgi:hypothetical protein